MKRVLAAVIAILLVTSSYAFGAKPLIGISSGWNGSSSSVGNAYFTSVILAGGTPVIIPLVKDGNTAEAIVDHLDGVIMTGGEDVNPEYYGEDILNATVQINHERDTSDMLIIAAAVKKKIPILGICRGEQIVNVFFGGSLYQDLPSQVGTELIHKQKESANIGTHTVCILEGSKMHRLLGTEAIAVNSFHHQGVKVLGKGLMVSAKAPDGVVEAYEGDKIFCTQFHPEGFVSKGDKTFLPIFQEFIKSASKTHKSHRHHRMSFNSSSSSQHSITNRVQLTQ